MSRDIRIIGVPIDLGQSKRGVDMGPAALRYAGLAGKLTALGHRVEDAGNLDVPMRETVAAEAARHYLPAIVRSCRAVYSAAREAIEAGETPIFIGGDHSLAIGSIGGVTAVRPCGLLWFDAHADFNTPTTTLSGNIHGMTLAVLLGEGYPELVEVGRPGPKLGPDDVVLVGIRDLDPGERERLRTSGIMVYTMRDIDERGMRDVVEEAVRIAGDGTVGIHLSFDLDVVDPEDAPGTGTPVWGGITYREAHLAMEICADRANIVSMDFVEVNPVLDNQNTTAILATELAQSALGKTIY
jgi:arginase